MKAELFDRYAPALKAANGPVARDKQLAMEPEGDIQIFYAPFEYINPNARIVLVGITPGPTQMVNANNEARKALLAGASHEEAIRRAKEKGAFSGEPMRSNLIHQLDHWGFQDWLGLKSTSELFDKYSHLVQTTSLLRYPVFVRGDDYRGTPDMTKHPLLRKYLFNHFIKEVNEMKDAVFLSLGPAVKKVLDKLVTGGNISPDRLFSGLLHPSGNNTYRIQYLIKEDRGPVPHATNPLAYDIGRKLFRIRYIADQR